jgi:hypothetical protein
MGNKRELAKIVSKQTWRTIVVAGAMLGAPLAITACGDKPKPQHPHDDPNWGKPTPGDDQKPTADDQKAADDAAARKAADDEAARLLAEKEAADKAAKEEADKKAKEEADKKAEEDAKKRPRGGGNRPTGRGFILS